MIEFFHYFVKPYCALKVQDKPHQPFSRVLNGKTNDIRFLFYLQSSD